jgi:hypothetical protein
MRFRVRISVDFPQPEGPITAVILFGWQVIVTSLMALDFP